MAKRTRKRGQKNAVEVFRKKGIWYRARDTGEETREKRTVIEFPSAVNIWAKKKESGDQIEEAPNLRRPAQKKGANKRREELRQRMTPRA